MSAEEKREVGILVIKNKAEFNLVGVNNVLGFDEYSVTLDTTLGELIVEGSELKIEKLTGEGGEVVIKGNISGAYYSGKKESRGFFKGLFK